jgi:oligoribonuclease
MHEKSGLFQRVQTEGKDERVVITDFTALLIEFLKKPDKKIFLAGNTVHFDRSFISEQWPSIMPWLSHRHLDVSSFKVFAEGRGVKKFSTDSPAHRAMDDINHSLKEFAYYVEEIKKLT